MEFRVMPKDGAQSAVEAVAYARRYFHNLAGLTLEGEPPVVTEEGPRSFNLAGLSSAKLFDEVSPLRERLGQNDLPAFLAARKFGGLDYGVSVDGDAAGYQMTHRLVGARGVLGFSAHSKHGPAVTAYDAEGGSYDDRLLLDSAGVLSEYWREEGDEALLAELDHLYYLHMPQQPLPAYVALSAPMPFRDWSRAEGEPLVTVEPGLYPLDDMLPPDGRTGRWLRLMPGDRDALVGYSPASWAEFAGTFPGEVRLVRVRTHTRGELHVRCGQGGIPELDAHYGQTFAVIGIRSAGHVVESYRIEFPDGFITDAPPDVVEYND